MGGWDDVIKGAGTDRVEDAPAHIQRLLQRYSTGVLVSGTVIVITLLTMGETFIGVNLHTGHAVSADYLSRLFAVFCGVPVVLLAGMTLSSSEAMRYRALQDERAATIAAARLERAAVYWSQPPGPRQRRFGRVCLFFGVVLTLPSIGTLAYVGRDRPLLAFVSFLYLFGPPVGWAWAMVRAVVRRDWFNMTIILLEGGLGVLVLGLLAAVAVAQWAGSAAAAWIQLGALVISPVAACMLLVAGDLLWPRLRNDGSFWSLTGSLLRAKRQRVPSGHKRPKEWKHWNTMRTSFRVATGGVERRVLPGSPPE